MDDQAITTSTPPQDTANAAPSAPEAQGAAAAPPAASKPTPAAKAPVVAVPAQAKPTSDWVQVQLTDAGRTFAGPSGVVHIANGHMQYSFKGTSAPRALRFAEWGKVLSQETINGQPLFELVPDSAK